MPFEFKKTEIEGLMLINKNSGSLDWKGKMWNLWNSLFLAFD